MMTKLFHDKELFMKDRPIKITEEQEKQFFIDEAEKFIKWQWSEGPAATIARDLKAISKSFYSSGFELAKDLERDGGARYNISGEVVDYLESLTIGQRYILDENVKAWVAAHDIKPKFSKGQLLKIQIDIDREYVAGKDVFITGIYDTTAHYIIHQDKNHNGGRYVTFEKLEASCIVLK